MEYKEIYEGEELTSYASYDQDPVIMVMGVGGGGGNIVTQMYQEADLDGVQFALCNTDAQHLNKKHQADVKIQLGATGEGAGGNMEQGRICAEYQETQDELTKSLSAESLKMLFVVATLGGGTGTGAAPIIAKTAKTVKKKSSDGAETEDILVVGVVTLPSLSDGEGDIKMAIKGLKELMKYADTVIIIRNDGDAKSISDDQPNSAVEREKNKIPIQAVKAISWIINDAMKENIDFNDIKSILKADQCQSGLISIGYGTGPDRLKNAIKEATESDFLNNQNIYKARRLLYCLFDKSEQYGEEVELRVGEIGRRNTSIIKTEFRTKFNDIEQSNDGRQKYITSGYGQNFPKFEEDKHPEADAIGFIVLATGFLFREDEFVDDWEEEDDKATQDQDPDIKNEFYDRYAEKREIINLSAEVCALNPKLIDDEQLIEIFEKKNPGLREKGFPERKAYIDRLKKANKS